MVPVLEVMRERRTFATVMASGQSQSIAYGVHRPEGPTWGTLLFLHGLGSCGQDWALQIPVFSSHYKVVTPDLPGHGRSSWSGKPLCFKQIAADLAGLLDQLGEPRAHVVSLSLGGLIALQLALDYPQKIDRLALVNSFARFRVTGRGLTHGVVRIGLFSMGRMDLMGRRISKGLFPHPHQENLRQLAAQRIASNDRMAYRSYLQAITRFDRSEDICAIQPLTLIVAGEHDRTVPLAWKQSMARLIPRARFTLIPNSGHATPLDSPKTFNRALLNFLEPRPWTV